MRDKNGTEHSEIKQNKSRMGLRMVEYRRILCLTRALNTDKYQIILNTQEINLRTERKNCTNRD